jgi:hypothetical protein
MGGLRVAKREAFISAAEQAVDLLLQITKRPSVIDRGKGKAETSVTPLVMASSSSDHEQTGVVEPHQQVEMYSDASLCSLMIGRFDAAEHFMALAHRQGNGVYDIYSYGYALIQSAFLTIPRGMWAVSMNNLKLGITLLESCHNVKVDRLVAVAQANIAAMAIIQGTLNKALDCLNVGIVTSDEEARLLLEWCRVHVLLMKEAGAVSDYESLFTPFFEKGTTHLNYHNQLLWISLICKRSWKMKFMSRTIASLLDAYDLAINHDPMNHCSYFMCFGIINILEVLFDILEDPESLAGIRSFIGAEYDLRKITETFLGVFFPFLFEHLSQLSSL